MSPIPPDPHPLVPTSAPTPASIEEIVFGEVSRWEECEGAPEATLLRIALLRDLTKNLKFEKSRCLANGLKDQVQTIKAWELRIDELRERAYLQGDFRNAFSPSQTPQKKRRIVPLSLAQRLGPEELSRFDRKWEAVLTSEAHALKWQFWTLEASVEVPWIDEWTQALVQSLWPHGLVLFSQNSEEQPTKFGIPLNSPSNVDSPFWRGRWTLTLKPHFRDETDLSLNFSQWPGTPEEPPAPTKWDKLFP